MLMNRRRCREFGGLAVVRAAVMTGFALLIARCAWIALVDGREHAARAVQQRAADVVVARLRGQIFDRDMRPLAGTSLVSSSMRWPSKHMVVVFPSMVSGPDDALRGLDELIPGLEIRSGSPRAVALSPEAYERVYTELSAMSETVRGIVPLSVSSRYSKLAAHVVGHLRQSSSPGAVAAMGASGADGIEASYDWALSSDACDVVRLMCDPYGREIPGLGARRLARGQPAGWVRLALNSSLQACVEDALDRRAPGMAGAVVAMDPWTGEVLAMASRPVYDPDDVAGCLARSDAPMINRAIRPYYPGSIFKVVVAAAALSTGARNPESIYSDTGSIEAGGHLFRCHAQERGGHGEITFADALIHSCNTSFVDAAVAVGAQPILDLARALGIGDPDVSSAVRLPGAMSGSLPQSRAKLGAADLANLALGQSLVQITPLEAAVMMSAVANGGLACRPTLVLEACGPDGRRVTRVAPSAQRVMSAAVAAELGKMLSQVASRGTASAALGGMDVAGKTGTAQTGRVGEAGAPVFNAWFVGFAPAHSPRLVVAVLIEGPASGADVAAPVFGDICESVMGAAQGRAR